MLGDIPTKDGKVQLPISSYQPSLEIRDFTAKIKKDYGIGDAINKRPFKEFNDRSLLQIMDDSQKLFNSWTEPPSDDPNESWRWKGTRPITRNKLISIAAHVTSTIIYPAVFAQNDLDEEDKEAANIMRDLIKWNIRNSDYEENFLFGVISALVNPVVWMRAEFVEVLQTIRQKAKDGTISTKEVIDETLSGLNTYVIPPDEMLISNPYEYNLQRQRFLIRKRWIDYDEAQALYGEHENFKYIQPGVKCLYNDADGMFYDQHDTELQTLCEEITYYNRREDLEVVFVNGIYLGKPDPYDNPIKHRRTVRDRDGNPVEVPIYPFVKSGYEPIDEKRFFFYKSAAEKLAKEQELVDTMYRMVMDGTFLAVMPPIATTGAGQVDSTVIFPGAVTNFGEEATITPINIGQNLPAGYRALQELEKSMSEGSQSEIQRGIPPTGGKTAYEIAQLQQNARIQLGLFGKMLASLVRDLGYLIIDLIIHHQTLGEVEEITGGTVRMRYRKFLLPDEEGGKKITKKIEFSEDLLGKEMTKEEKLKESAKILEEEGGIESDVRIFKVNPELFSRLRFLLTVNADTLLPKNEAFEKAIKLEAYDRMIINPWTNKPNVTRDYLVEPFAKGETDKYMMKTPDANLLQQLASRATGAGKSTPLVEQTTRNRALTGILERSS